MPEYDLVTKDGVAKLIDLMEERSPIETLDANIRQRLVKNGSPITIDKAQLYEKLLAQ